MNILIIHQNFLIKDLGMYTSKNQTVIYILYFRYQLIRKCFNRYDEFSGGSGSEAAYDVSGNSAVTTTPSLQSVVVVSTSTTVPPPPPPTAPNIRHLQKERVHLLEQLEECPSSGDELVSPKKRFKVKRILNFMYFLFYTSI